MLRANWTARIAIILLLPAACFADDGQPSVPTGDTSQDATPAAHSLRDMSPYAPRWQMPRTLETIPYTRDTSAPIAKFEFADNSALGRIRGLRGFSLLTLGRVGKSRLFLGVNDDGLVGLHFNLLPRDSDERYLEVIRMPYLKEDDTSGDAQ